MHCTVWLYVCRHAQYPQLYHYCLENSCQACRLPVSRKYECNWFMLKTTTKSNNNQLAGHFLATNACASIRNNTWCDGDVWENERQPIQRDFAAVIFIHHCRTQGMSKMFCFFIFVTNNSVIASYHILSMVTHFMCLKNGRNNSSENGNLLQI